MRLAHYACATSYTVQVVNAYYRPPVTLYEERTGGHFACVNKGAAAPCKFLQIDCQNEDSRKLRIPRNRRTTSPIERTVERKKTEYGQAIVNIGKGVWRIYRVQVPVEQDLGKDDFTIFDALLEAVAAVLGCTASCLPRCAFSVV